MPRHLIRFRDWRYAILLSQQAGHCIIKLFNFFDFLSIYFVNVKKFVIETFEMPHEIIDKKMQPFERMERW